MQGNKIQQRKIIIDLMVLTLSFSFILICSSLSNIRLFGIYIIVLSLALLVRWKDNIFTFVIGAFILYSNYSIIVANYFLDLNYFILSDSKSEVSIQGLRVICVFVTCLFIFINSSVEKKNHCIEFSYPKRVSNVIGFIYIFILIFLLIFGFVRPDVSGERGTPSPLYEYSISFFIVGYYFYRNNKIYLIISSILLFFFALQNLVYGGRITALQVLLVFFILFINKNIKPNYRKLILLFLVIAIPFFGIGQYRANFSLSSEGVNHIIESIKTNAFTFDTAYAAFFTSLTFIKVESILPLFERISIFFNWVASQLLGGSAVANSNVAAITKKYYMHYMGGVLPFFGHFHFGYVGVVLSAALVSKYTNKIIRFDDNADQWKCVLLYIAVTVPRWYLYSPSPLIRGALLTFILYRVSIFIDGYLLKKGVASTI